MQICAWVGRAVLGFGFVGLVVSAKAIKTDGIYYRNAIGGNTAKFHATPALYSLGVVAIMDSFINLLLCKVIPNEHRP